MHMRWASTRENLSLEVYEQQRRRPACAYNLLPITQSNVISTPNYSNQHTIYSQFLNPMYNLLPITQSNVQSTPNYSIQCTICSQLLNPMYNLLPITYSYDIMWNQLPITILMYNLLPITHPSVQSTPNYSIQCTICSQLLIPMT